MGKPAPAAARKMNVVDRVELEYRLYRVVAGEVGGVCKAVAYLGMGGLRPVEAVEGKSVEEAISLMNNTLAARLAALRADRRDGIPTAAEFRESLAALPATVREGIRDLHVETLDPLSPMPALAILSMRTQKDGASIVEDLRKAARRLGDLLDMDQEELGVEKDPIQLFGHVVRIDPDGIPELRFHDEFREALASLPPERPAMMVGRR